MTNGTPDPLGRVDDAEESAAEASREEGPAASGEYDASEGSPGASHPVGEAFPDEAVRYDDPQRRARSSTTGQDPEGTGS
jgi:hypothetical protein